MAQLKGRNALIDLLKRAAVGVLVDYQSESRAAMAGVSVE